MRQINDQHISLLNISCNLFTTILLQIINLNSKKTYKKYTIITKYYMLSKIFPLTFTNKDETNKRSTYLNVKHLMYFVHKSIISNNKSNSLIQTLQ